ncbi:MAG: hypothetical protein NVSMB1_11810 [Polyangiales bacterium]
MSETILLTGATGFVGTHLVEALTHSGCKVRCGTRDPARAAQKRPDRDWVKLDLNQAGAIGPALSGCRSAIYLVHSMAEGKGYAQRERASAQAFADEAAAAGLERIIYLGGVVPVGRTSRHLVSRRVTGEILRHGSVPVFELRAGMVVGAGSISWRIVRDLAARLPAMILPRWLSSLSQPIAIEDVVFAIEHALALPLDNAGIHELPGPETMSAKEILVRIARLLGKRPIMVQVPILSPRLSSYWLKLITGADYHVARELVEGLASDLVASGPELWRFFPEHKRLSFDEAARRALAEDAIVNAQHGE